jgi:hypothetical protein
VQNSGVVQRRVTQLSRRLSRERSTQDDAPDASLRSLLSVQQDEETLVLQRLRPWQSADVAAGRATPYIFHSGHQVRAHAACRTASRVGYAAIVSTIWICRTFNDNAIGMCLAGGQS